MFDKENGIIELKLDLLRNIDLFMSIKEDVKSHVLKAFNNTKYKVTFLENEYEDVPLGRIIVFMAILSPFVKRDMFVDGSPWQEIIESSMFKRLVSADVVNNSTFNPIFNSINDNAQEQDIATDTINYIIGEIIQELSYIGGMYNKVCGNTFSLYQLYQISKQYPEFDACLNYVSNEDMQVTDIEAEAGKTVKDGIKYLEQFSGTISNMAKCGAAINNKQMGQVLFNIGFKPSLKGKTLPHFINTSFLRGLRNTKDLFIISKAARKASITNFAYVRKSGYLARKLLLLVMNEKVTSEYSKCDTDYTVPVHITSDMDLKRFDKRFIKQGTEEVLITKRDKHLIGTTINLYSPITCSHSDGICHRCYGTLARVNKDYHAPILGTLNTSNQITQKQLSTKHLLQTNTQKFVYAEELDKFFSIRKNEIYLEDDNAKIIIPAEHIHLDFADNVYTTFITVQFKTKSYDFEFAQNLYLTELNVQPNAKGNIEFSKDDLDSNGLAFSIVLQNNEANYSLQLLIDLIEKKEHLGFSTYNTILEKMIELLNDSGFRSNAVHLENILRILVKDPATNKRPLFKGNSPSYIVQTVSEAILNNPIGISLMFQEHRRQLTNISIFDKTDDSILDPIYLHNSGNH